MCMAAESVMANSRMAADKTAHQEDRNENSTSETLIEKTVRLNPRFQFANRQAQV